MSKKRISIIAVALCVFFAGLLGFAIGGGQLGGLKRQSATSAESKRNIPVSIVGVVLKKQGGSLTIIAGEPEDVLVKQTKGQRVVLKVDSKTRYVESRQGQSDMPIQVGVSEKDIKKNDFVSIAATVNKAGVFTATCITSVRKTNSSSGKPSNLNAQGVASGTVALVKQEGFAVATESGEVIEVVTNPGTKFIIAFPNKAPEEVTSADVVADRKVTAIGAKLADGKIQATQVVLAK